MKGDYQFAEVKYQTYFQYHVWLHHVVYFIFTYTLTQLGSLFIIVIVLLFYIKGI